MHRCRSKAQADFWNPTRVGEPDDVGAVIATLLGDECRWITAQTIDVSGGFNL
jgi:NAD(P)-dependent dehydrogenase (short-subunit alcohol dehydrogenase family)